MRFLRAITNRPWKIVAVAVTALIVGYLSLFTAHFVPALSHAKTYMHSIENGGSDVLITSAQTNLTNDVNNIFNDLNAPVVKQIISALGFNFQPIKNELLALVKTGPILAGANSPKRYLIAFQNSAEARGTGGILGAFAIVEFDHGKLRVVQTGSNAMLKSLEEIPISMPAEYKTLYRSDPAIWQNSNLSPHFPYGARIWMQLWYLQTGERLDGVISIDPTALSHILKSTGPITLKSGEEITAENVVYKTLAEAYQRYEKDNFARKQYLVDIMNATFTRFRAMDFSKVEFAKQIVPVILENRLLIYTTDEEQEKSLSQTRLSGAMNLGPNNQYRAVILNIDASKLDYYLDRKISIKTIECGQSPKSEVSITVTNTVQHPERLSPYVLTRADKTKPADRATGQHRFKLFIYGPNGSTLISAQRSSTSGSAGGVSTERTRPILVSDIDLKPQESETSMAAFEGGTGALEFVDQPLVRPSVLSMKDSCKVGEP